MIEERDLMTLADPGSGPPISHPPLDAVVVRGKRLRRRRHALRALGAVTAIAGLAGAGLVVRGAESGNPEVTAADDSSTPPSAESSWPSSPPPPTDCETRASQEIEEIEDVEEIDDVESWVVMENVWDHTLLSPAEVPGEMRVIPTWTPEGEQITTTTGSRSTDPCPSRAPVPTDPALLLESAGDVTGRITLSGPLARAWGGGLEQEPTRLRGQDAILVHTDGPAYGWTDADGWSWWLSGNEDVEGSTVRAVAEALELDGSPEGDDPVAALAPEDLPPGFEILWQARGAPTPLGPEATKWSVVVGEQQAVTRGIVCQLEVESPVGESSLDMATYEGEVVTVNGQEAAWTTFLEHPVVVWEVAPGVRAGANCSRWEESGVHPLDLATHIRFAESVEPVAADDRRLP